MSTVKAQRPTRLSEDETHTSFEDWRNNLIFYLNQDANFKSFLKSNKTWEKSSSTTAHRGLASADELSQLKNFLGVIASLSPPLLHGDLIDESTSLANIFIQLREYYQFAPSEGTFMKFLDIKREIINGSMERPLHLYLRLRQFIRDNLLLKSGKIAHNGKVPETDEVLSPTTERLIVLRWLEILHPALPNHVAKVFAQDLQFKSLKDLQPTISGQIDDLLRQLDDNTASVSYTGIYSQKKDYNHGRNSGNSKNSFDDNKTSQSFSQRSSSFRRGGWNQKFQKSTPFVKKCDACYSVGEPFIGHTVRNCPNISRSDRSNMLKTFALEVDEDEEPEQLDEFYVEEVDTRVSECQREKSVITSRVNIEPSPQFNVRIRNKDVDMILDTGATGSMISADLCREIGLKIHPSPHSAIQADGDSILKVVGEVHTSIFLRDHLSLPLHAVVVQKLKAGLLVGMSFLKENHIVIDIPNGFITIGGSDTVHFSSKKAQPKVALLRVETNNVIFPGDIIPFKAPAEFSIEKEVALEPREESKFWFNPRVIANDSSDMELVNELDVPIKVRKGQIVGQIRSVVSPVEPVLREIGLPENDSRCTKSVNSNFTDPITIDPSGTILSTNERTQFKKVVEEFSSVFNPKYSTYNHKSGKLEASVHLGKTTPAPKKGKVPSYNSNKSILLQEKFDELVKLGVLSRPEDVNVKVVHTSPSFLVKKGDGSYRLVTSFVELNKYIQPMPAKLSTTNDVLTALGRWKYIIKTDLKSAYFQMRMEDSSKKWLGTNSPFKGMYVYNVGPMGLRNMAEYLEELVSRVFGDLIAAGVLTKIADDLIVGGQTVLELLSNWTNVLRCLHDNNLFLSANKTFICPASVSVIGWTWNNGTIEVDRHRINPLSTCEMPQNVKQLRSFIGAFRALSRCIPGYGRLLAPLEDMVAGKDSSDKLVICEELRQVFKRAQESLKSPKVLTLPHPSDQLILVSDGCNSPPAAGSTLYVKKGDKLKLGGFFSAKIGKHQLLWLPCEIEALCINLSISSFSHLIRESEHTTKFLTDSKACVQAFQKLEKGGFSLSPRISSFLMNLNSLNISINHVSGSSIRLTDFSSRNPINCQNRSCQVCQFVEEKLDIAVSSINLSDVVAGTFRMPFYNPMAWLDAQKSDPDLKRCFSQLSEGTRPGRKERDLKVLRRYLQIASISSKGVLIHRKANPFGRDYELIIIPRSLAPGLISALHLRLGHPVKTQFKKVWNRYFYAIEGENIIDDVTESCPLCTSLKVLPKELMEQGTTVVPDTIGKIFSCDVIRRESQKIVVLIDLFSLFMVGQFVPNEKHDSLRESIIKLTANYKHPDGSLVKVDDAPGFKSLVGDEILKSVGITVDLGRTKNKNKNASIDKGIQELEKEIKRIAPDGGQISSVTLALAISNLNHRIRANGLSSKEILTKRDLYTDEDLVFKDEMIQSHRYVKRLENHPSSEISKSGGVTKQTKYVISLGDIVHVKNEGSKHQARDFYLVTEINHGENEVYLQKFCGNQLRSRRYRMKLTEIYPAAANFRTANVEDRTNGITVNNEMSENENEEDQEEIQELRRSTRNRCSPDFLATEEIQRIPMKL